MTLLAKSDGTTLSGHIQDCLTVYTELKRCLPQLPATACCSDFWQLLFIAVYLHDFGKAHAEFQKELKGQRNVWNHQRHELYSIPFVDKADMSEAGRMLIKRAILGHHRDFHSLLFEKYKTPELLADEWNNHWRDKGMDFHPEDFLKNIRSGRLDMTELKGLLESIPNDGSLPAMTASVDLMNYPHPYPEIAGKLEELNVEQDAYWQNLVLWGALKICDHYGSGGVRELHCLSPFHFRFLDFLEKRLNDGGSDFHRHQKQCFASESHCLLIAPTGSGKTEAAVGWLRRQMDKDEGRVYYILPYTASINAMHQRLVRDMDGNEEYTASTAVGVQHGKLTQYLAILSEAESMGECDPERVARIRDAFRRMVHPLKVITPFQILKYFYGVKGFEMGLSQLAGGRLIFDEIHAYDTITFAQILEMLVYGIRFLNFRVMIMTATLPSFMLKLLKETLGVEAEIRADDELLRGLRRHRIDIREGGIMERVPDIVKYLDEGKRVIVVCNTVLNAQEMMRKISELDCVTNKEAVLLHGRFTADDRLEKEQRIQSDDTRLLIGTQAIEVSLDIDYDIMVTEPAPLDALLQRFGRVNRRNKADAPCPIIVCRERGEHDSYIYSPDIVHKTLKCLEEINVLSEADVQRMLDEVYPGFSEKDARLFEDTRKLFREAIRNLQPYSCHKEREEEFYERFDGIEVLPAVYYDRYRHLIEEFNFIKAERLKVSVRKGSYHHLKQQGLIEFIPIDIVKRSGDILRSTVLVAKCCYTSELGMTREPDKIQTDQGFIC